jgi:hypothetical protein
VTAVSKSCRLREQSPVNQRRGEIANGLAFYQYLVVNQVVASCQTDHPHVERAALEHSAEERRLFFGVADMEAMDPTRHGAFMGGFTINAPRSMCSRLEGKPKSAVR